MLYCVGEYPCGTLECMSRLKLHFVRLSALCNTNPRITRMTRISLLRVLGINGSGISSHYENAQARYEFGRIYQLKNTKVPYK